MGVYAVKKVVQVMCQRNNLEPPEIVHAFSVEHIPWKREWLKDHHGDLQALYADAKDLTSDKSSISFLVNGPKLLIVIGCGSDSLVNDLAAM